MSNLDPVTRAQQFQEEVSEALAPRALAQEAMAAASAAVDDTEPRERPLLLGIGGHLEAGKDTLADYLVTEYGFHKLNMSDPLAQALYTENPYIPVSELVKQPDGTVTGRFSAYRDIIDADGYTEAKKNSEVRRLLQVLGTEVGRDQIDPEIWTKVARRNIENLRESGTPVAITGIRFVNELAMIREAGGITVWVERPTPDLLAYGQLEQPQRPTQHIGHQMINAIDQALDPTRAQFHTSELTLTEKDFDIRVLNDGSVEQLHERTNALIAVLHDIKTGTYPDLDAPYFKD